MTDGHKSCYSIDGWTEVIGVALLCVSCVQAHAHAQAVNACKIFFGEGKLGIKRCTNRIWRSGESDAERIADGLEDVTAVLLYRSAHELFVTRHSSLHRLAVLLPALRRAFDVGKEKRHRASRQGSNSLRLFRSHQNDFNNAKKHLGFESGCCTVAVL